MFNKRKINIQSGSVFTNLNIGITMSFDCLSIHIYIYIIHIYNSRFENTVMLYMITIDFIHILTICQIFILYCNKINMERSRKKK